MSSTVRGVPLATLNAPWTGSGAVSASTLARATSRTCTKSRRWPPSSKTCGALPVGQRGAEDARHAGVGRVARHPRPVDVVVAQRGHRHAGLARERRAQVLLGDLGASRRRCGGPAARPRAPCAASSARPQTGHGGSNSPASSACAPARARPHEAVLGAGVAALAVDDHARGEHDPPAEAARRQRPQQLRGRQVVVADVVGDVGDVGPEPDHRGLVADRGDAVARRARRPPRRAGRPRRTPPAGRRSPGRSRCAAGSSASTIRTASPRSSSSSTTCDPMKPAPPVTRIMAA